MVNRRKVFVQQFSDLLRSGRRTGVERLELSDNGNLVTICFEGGGRRFTRRDVQGGSRQAHRPALAVALQFPQLMHPAALAVRTDDPVLEVQPVRTGMDAAVGFRH